MFALAFGFLFFIWFGNNEKGKWLFMRRGEGI